MDERIFRFEHTHPLPPPSNGCGTTIARLSFINIHTYAQIYIFICARPSPPAPRKTIVPVYIGELFMCGFRLWQAASRRSHRVPRWRGTNACVCALCVCVCVVCAVCACARSLIESCQLRPNEPELCVAAGGRGGGGRKARLCPGRHRHRVVYSYTRRNMFAPRQSIIVFLVRCFPFAGKDDGGRLVASFVRVPVPASTYNTSYPPFYKYSGSGVDPGGSQVHFGV